MGPIRIETSSWVLVPCMSVLQLQECPGFVHEQIVQYEASKVPLRFGKDVIFMSTAIGIGGLLFRLSLFDGLYK